MKSREEELLAYACAKFEQGSYDEALEVFVLLYQKGYEKDWILQTIYQCYVDGNETEFRTAYEACKKDGFCAYEACTLDFIPYQEGNYFVFDKEKQAFSGNFSIRELQTTEQNPLLDDMEFGSVAVAGTEDMRQLYSVLQAAKQRKIYLVTENMKGNSSYGKIPELAEYMQNVYLFHDFSEYQAYFHTHKAEYLPILLFGSPEDRNRMDQITEEEHAYRLTPEGRDNSNVLLTIGIPTYHRGNLLLKRLEHLKKMPYDAEIEIAVSKNGLDHYEEEYRQASKDPDARIVYRDQGEELIPVLNWHRTVELAHGEYVMFVSDEDDVILGALDHYLAILQNHPELYVVRPRTEFQHSIIQKRSYRKKGLDAFEKSFLVQNYLSGLIMRREAFLEEDFLKLQKYEKNVFYRSYPHEWWCAALIQKGDYLEEPVSLIDEQDSVLEEELGFEKKKEDDTFVPPYATYEYRLEQLKGMIEYLNIFIKDEPDWKELGMKLIMRKVPWLYALALARNYDLEHYHLRVKEYAQICIDAIMQISLGEDKTKELLKYLQDTVVWLENQYNEQIIKNQQKQLERNKTE